MYLLYRKREGNLYIISVADFTSLIIYFNGNPCEDDQPCKTKDWLNHFPSLSELLKPNITCNVFGMHITPFFLWSKHITRILLLKEIMGIVHNGYSPQEMACLSFSFTQRKTEFENTRFE